MTEKLLTSQSQLDTEHTDFLKVIGDWNGDYAPDSRGAAAYEIAMANLLDPIVARRYKNEGLRKALLRANAWFQPFEEELSAISTKDFESLFREKFPRISSQFKKYPVWGDMHRMVVQHPLGNIPMIGSRFRYLEYPSPGGYNTLLKSAHRSGDEKGSVTFGAQSRHLSDMSDLNENYFALISGQDGWLRTENSREMSEMWQKGEYFRFPLELPEIKKSFKRKTIFRANK